MKKRIALLMVLALLAVAVAIPLQAAFADSSNLQSLFGFTATLDAPPSDGPLPANCPTPPAGAKFVQAKLDAGTVRVGGVTKDGKPDTITLTTIGKPTSADAKGIVVIGKASTTTAKTFSVTGTAPATGAASVVSCGQFHSKDDGTTSTTNDAPPPPSDGSLKSVPCSDETKATMQFTDENGKPLKDAPVEIQCFEFVPAK